MATNHRRHIRCQVKSQHRCAQIIWYTLCDTTISKHKSYQINHITSVQDNINNITYQYSQHTTQVCKIWYIIYKNRTSIDSRISRRNMNYYESFNIYNIMISQRYQDMGSNISSLISTSITGPNTSVCIPRTQVYQPNMVPAQTGRGTHHTAPAQTGSGTLHVLPAQTGKGINPSRV